MEINKVIQGYSLQALKTFADNSIDSVVTDPPYGLGKEPNIIEVMKDWVEKGYHELKSKAGGFMNKEWDSFVPQPNLWKEVYRVLKPGGYMLVACGTRTQDWMTTSLRFAGFEVRDVITWHYGTGFPKSMDISKQFDKNAGAEREVVGQRQDILLKQGKDLREGKRKIVDSLNSGAPERNNGFVNVSADITAPSTESAKQWDGWGTALKPATEFWTLVRKPISENTVAENILKWGVGGINIDGCRIESSDDDKDMMNKKASKNPTHNYSEKDDKIYGAYAEDKASPANEIGRFPANVIFDEFSAEELDKQSGISKSSGGSGEKSKGAMGVNGKYGLYALNIKAANAGGIGDLGGLPDSFM